MVKSNYYKKQQNLARYNIAEMNNLVTSPPPKQQQYIDGIKREIDEMNCQEITITFKPSLMQTSDLTLRTIVHGFLQNILEGKARLALIHEYSDAGRFHYHGIISGATKKILSTIRKQMTLHIGRIEIKTITYFDSYLRYMTKQVIEEDHDRELNIYINI